MKPEFRNRNVDPVMVEAATRRQFLAMTAALPALSTIGGFSLAELCARAAEPTDASAAAPNPISMEKLHAEFAEECQIMWKYMAFAQKAQEEGRPRVAKLFRAVAEAERVHANILLFVMSAVKTTQENLKFGADYESFLIEGVFPKAIETAEKDRDPAAALTFHRFLGAGVSHAKVFTDALAALDKGKDMADAKISICPICGHVMVGDGTEVCPICRTQKAKFVLAT